MADRKQIIDTIIVPVIAWLIFILPLLNQAIQIDITKNQTIPIHWAMVIAAAIGGTCSIIVVILKSIYKDKEEKINKIVESLNNQLKLNLLERDISERDIMLNSACLNEQWLLKNTSIEDLERLIIKKKNLKKD